MSFDKPIFVRGFSRSGGTLLVSILDSHPQISMNYELYEGLLARPVDNKHAEFDVSSSGYDIEEVHRVLEEVCASDTSKNLDKIALNALRGADFHSVGVFMARMARGGTLANDFCCLIGDWINKGWSWQTVEQRLGFIGLCAQHKSLSKDSNYWGLKCSNSFNAYLDVWPDAKFINIVRDPRDIYASQLVNGNFNPIPKVVGESWLDLHLKFDEFKKASPQNAYAYRYEDLVRDPESAVLGIFDFLNIPYDPAVLRYNEQDLTIFDNPRGHLSIDRISKPIDITSVGRYAQEISMEEISVIEESCEEKLKQYQYI